MPGAQQSWVRHSVAMSGSSNSSANLFSLKILSMEALSSSQAAPQPPPGQGAPERACSSIPEQGMAPCPAPGGYHIPALVFRVCLPSFSLLTH